MKNFLFVGSSSEEAEFPFFQSLLQKEKQNWIIFDFNKKKYGEEFGSEILLDKVNPLLGTNTLHDAMALNAGYINKGNRMLYEKCKEILEYDGISNKSGLISEAIERLTNGWTRAELDVAKEMRRAPKPSRNHVSMDELMETIFSEIHQHGSVRLRSKSMHSSHQRAVLFNLMSRISRTSHFPVTFVVDDLKNLLFTFGNTRLFVNSLNLDNFSLLAHFSKLSAMDNEAFELFNGIVSLDENEDAPSSFEEVKSKVSSVQDYLSLTTA